MPQQDGPRLDGRDGVVWREYLSGRKQADIADDFGLSQQRVSQIIAEVRAMVGDRDRSVMAVMDMERLTFLMDAQMPAAMKGDVGASRVVLAALARRAKMLGLDAAEPLRVTFERHLETENEVIGEAVSEVVNSLVDVFVGSAAPERGVEVRDYALRLLQWKLLQVGEQDPGPRPVAPALAGVVPEPSEPERDLVADYRAFCAAEGVDPDEDLDDEEDDDDE